jgi:hypothetical protein
MLPLSACSADSWYCENLGYPVDSAELCPPTPMKNGAAKNLQRRNPNLGPSR